MASGTQLLAPPARAAQRTAIAAPPVQQYGPRVMDFAPPSAPPLLVSGFVFLPMLVVLIALMGVASAVRRAGLSQRDYWLVAVLLVAAMVASLWLAAEDLLTRFDSPPRLFLPLTATSITLWVGIASSRVGRALGSLPLAALVAFHAFRLPLELLMHAAAGAGVMPIQMSFSGWNFDIVTGATALVVAPLALFGLLPRHLLLAWNALGSVLLLVIVAIAVASTPPWLAFGSDAALANTWVAYAPFVWLPTVLVPAAAAGHVVLWQRWLREAAAPPASPPGPA